MNLSIGSLVKGAVWTVGAFGIGQALRLGTNVVLTRLLAPELFGLMLIVNTLRTGMELISDIGIGQNIVYSKNALESNFYNTAWSLQIIRGIGLWLVFSLVSIPVARFYNSPILAAIVPISGISILFAGFSSLAPSVLQKELKFARLNIVTLIASTFSSLILIVFAYFNRTIWALVLGGVVGSAFSMAGGYFIVPGLKHKFHIDKRSASEISGFGKWIFMSSMVFFVATNFDRLYFARVVPLQLLGVYGIARSLADLLANVEGRLSVSVVFPFIASHGQLARAALRQQLATIRARYLLLAALGSSLFIATADFMIKLLYDERYRAAGQMVPILVIGGWFTMLGGVNESTLWGLGRPSYSAIANTVRFVLLLIGLPVSFKLNGLTGGVMTLAVVEVCRYVVIFVGQKRERFSFGRQDLAVTLMMFMLVGLWEWLRWAWGVGTSLDSLMESFPR